MRYRLLENPNLNCNHCFRMWQDEGVPTLCEQGANPSACPLGDCAPDLELSEFVDNYIQAKCAGQGGNSTLETRITEALGLYEDLELYIALEGIWADYIKFERKRQQLKGRQGRHGNRRY